EMTKRFQFKAVAAPRYEEEHRTWSVSFTDSQGAERRIDWTLASTPEYRQMMSKHVQIKEALEPPFLIEYASSKAATATVPAPEETEGESTGEIEAGKPAPKRSSRVSLDPVEKQTPQELFEYVIEQGRRE